MEKIFSMEALGRELAAGRAYTPVAPQGLLGRLRASPAPGPGTPSMQRRGAPYGGREWRGANQRGQSCPEGFEHIYSHREGMSGSAGWRVGVPLNAMGLDYAGWPSKILGRKEEKKK